jgi:hypothetical protein
MTDAASTPLSKRLLAIVGLIAGWGWFLFCGGGGLGLIITRGPWPVTNGWFALFSGLSACPATAWILRKTTGVRIPGWVQLALAVGFIIAGRTALAIEGRPFWPHPDP